MKNYNMIWFRAVEVLLVIELFIIIFYILEINFTDVNETWLGFYGSVIGAGATIIGVFLTVGYYRKRDKKQLYENALPRVGFTKLKKMHPNPLRCRIFLSENEEIGPNDLVETDRLCLVNTGRSAVLDVKIVISTMYSKEIILEESIGAFPEGSDFDLMDYPLINQNHQLMVFFNDIYKNKHGFYFSLVNDRISLVEEYSKEQMALFEKRNEKIPPQK